MNQYINQQTMNPNINPYLPQNRTTYIQPQNGINWVQGIEGAKAWQLPPNSNTILLDSDCNDRFYIKISDNVGMCTLRVFNYTEITNAPTSSSVDIDMSQYVRRDEVEQLIKSMIGGQSNEQPIPATSSTKSSKLITK